MVNVIAGILATVPAPAALGRYSAASSVLPHEVIEAKPIHPRVPLQALHDRLRSPGGQGELHLGHPLDE